MNVPNCEVDYVDIVTGVVTTEKFHDPFIYKLRDGLTVAMPRDVLVAVPSFGASGVVVRHDGKQWTLGPAYAGRPVISSLITVSDLSVPPPKQR